MFIGRVVNSVPRFENAWMKRKKFPYTARSTAKVIRHAVSIDERRAKFRSDLISEAKTSTPNEQGLQRREGGRTGPNDNWMTRGEKQEEGNMDRFRRKSRVRSPLAEDRLSRQSRGPGDDHLDPRRNNQGRRASPRTTASRDASPDVDGSSVRSGASMASFQPGFHPDEDEDEDEVDVQDIEELWFPGCHADLGGGWPPAKGEESPLSHAPLVWMVREAQRAGVEFDPEKMLKFKCCDEDYKIPSSSPEIDTHPPPNMPEIQISSPAPQENPGPDIFTSPRHEKPQPGWAAGLEPEKPVQSQFHRILHDSYTKGILHDCLEFNNGLSLGSVLSWKMMEYLPFRRMDLRADGSWKAISLPLPMGETRDIPENAWIHHSAIRRMEANEQYRPGNLIIGGGGRGVRRAPKEMGVGKWEILKGEGDMVGMTYVRKGPSLEKQEDEKSFRKKGKEEQTKKATNGT